MSMRSVRLPYIDDVRHICMFMIESHQNGENGFLNMISPNCLTYGMTVMICFDIDSSLRTFYALLSVAYSSIPPALAFHPSRCEGCCGSAADVQEGVRLPGPGRPGDADQQPPGVHEGPRGPAEGPTQRQHGREARVDHHHPAGLLRDAFAAQEPRDSQPGHQMGPRRHKHVSDNVA
eukprot:scaffold37742_cov24-Prasinocladus_malaysianus.AAC.1